MVKATLSWWSRLVERIHAWDLERRSIRWEEGLSQDDEKDMLEIRQVESVIIQHQYLCHMAKARIEARAAWRRLQEQAVQGSKT
jgi:hypothetical protein